MKALIGAGLFLISQAFLFNIAEGSLHYALIGCGDIMLVSGIMMIYESGILGNEKEKKW